MDIGRIELGPRERCACLDEPMIRYGNDVQLTALQRELKNQMQSIDDCTTNGRLDHAFLVAHQMEYTLDAFKSRLNDLKYGRT